MKSRSTYVAMALLMLACHPKSEKLSEEQLHMIQSSPEAMEMTMSEPPPPKEMVSFVPPVIKEDEVQSTSPGEPIEKKPVKKIIKDGNISIKTKKPEAAKNQLDIIVRAASGYYEKEEFENNDYKSAYKLVIRVLSSRFEKFIRAAEKTDGEVTYKSINARDVTENYTDTEIRLTSKRLFRKRYNELLTIANKVPDILAIEENIRVLQEEIESQEGHLKYLDDQVAYSTLELTLFTIKEIKTAVKKETFGELVKTSLGNGWQTVIDLMLWSIRQWPWMIVVFVLTFFIKRYRRNLKSRNV